ncbi:MAG: YcgL domain-containing protein [Thiogranum sp.]|nr:YcgL domain-containing protein [Thiogranum sp.]
MQCVVYKSLKQADYYLFLNRDDEFSRVPDGLKQLLGALVQVVEIDLHPQRKLAQVDVVEVMQQIDARGYFLQMPARPGIEPPVA